MIKLLPDNVANQIAAGEVVQRPASVVKELLENAIDAGANQISLIIKDAGRTLIQVIDNGKGMSPIDARLSFERHATSKIETVKDLEQIITFGFRGEALASIASVAEVSLKTKEAESELGTEINIQASRVVSQSVVQCPQGANFSVRNLFYNIPARRKFLKSDTVELRHIISEFQRVSICNPQIKFDFINNDNNLYSLHKSNLKQRLINLFSKNLNNNLIDVGVDTHLVKITGFIGKPEIARKTLGEQFLFVNGRFFRSPYFQKAVFNAYSQLLPPDTFPSFFLFLETDPSRIDVNIHPAKTEIKFDEEQGVWQIINAIVRESLSKFAITPSIIFDNKGAIDIPVFKKDAEFKAPTVKVDTGYNPFKTNNWNKEDVTGWENLFNADQNQTINVIPEEDQKQTLEDNREVTTNRFMQIKGKYIITPVKSGLMIIDIYRAHQRILYERFLSSMAKSQGVSQKLLIPKEVQLDAADYMIMQTMVENLIKFGFDIRCAGENTIMYYGLPSGFGDINTIKLTEEILHSLKENYKTPEEDIKERIALSFAKAEALKHSREMHDKEIQFFIDQLFACNHPNIGGDGKTSVSIITMNELEKRLQK